MMFLPAAIAKMNEAQQENDDAAAPAPAAAPSAAASASSAAAAAPSSATSSSSSGLAPSLFLSSLSKSSVDEWLDHCAFCFRDKLPHPPPRSYFATHLAQDPQADLNGIAVVRVKNPALHKPSEQEAEEEKAEIEIKGRTAEQAAKEAAEAEARKKAAAALAAAPTIIAATARVFVRRCYIGGQEITFGGIGEVCTRPEFRSQGLSTLCLERCERYQRLLRMQLGSLHASKEMAAFYAARGYTAIPRVFGVKSDWESESDAAGIVGEGRKHGAFSLRLMPLSHFFAPTMLPQFMSMYAEHSPLYNGAVVRNEDYWRSWVQSNLEGSVGSSSQYPTEIYAAFEEWDGSDPAPVPASPIRFLAYMFLQRQSYDPQSAGASAAIGGAGAGAAGKYDRVYELKEYAVSAAWGEKRADKGRQMFLSLVTWAVRQIRHKMIEVDAAAGASANLFVRFPLPLIARFPVSVKLAAEIADEGFMFRALPLQMDAKAAAAEEKRNASTQTVAHRSGSAIVEESPLASPLAASPFVLHHPSEELTADSAAQIMQRMQEEAKKRVLFWKTDSF